MGPSVGLLHNKNVAMMGLVYHRVEELARSCPCEAGSRPSNNGTPKCQILDTETDSLDRMRDVEASMLATDTESAGNVLGRNHSATPVIGTSVTHLVTLLTTPVASFFRNSVSCTATPARNPKP